MPKPITVAAEVLDFWFGPTPSMASRGKLWFGKDPATDALIRERFLDTLERARDGELESWLEAPDGALALIVLLDQFSRNLYRDLPLAFAADARALNYARRALERGHDQALEPVRRIFLYLPFEHSEDLADQRRSVKLFARLDDEQGVGDVYDYALRHYAVIQRFGRFPHRNAVLGRASTAAENAFLNEPGSRF